MTHAPRSLALLRNEGCIAETTEHWNSFTNHRNDLFGFGDLLAIRPGQDGSTIVQCSSLSDIGAHVTKAMSMPAFWPWVMAGNMVEFHGWFKAKAPTSNRIIWQAERRTYERADAGEL